MRFTDGDVSGFGYTLKFIHSVCLLRIGLGSDLGHWLIGKAVHTFSLCSVSYLFLTLTGLHRGVTLDVN